MVEEIQVLLKATFFLQRTSQIKFSSNVMKKKLRFQSFFLFKTFDKDAPATVVTSTKEEKSHVTFNDGTLIRILRKIRKSPALKKRNSPKKRKSPKKNQS